MAANDDAQLLQAILERAKRAGADSADALVVHATAISHAQRLGQVERLEREEGHDLGLRVFLGRRQAIASSTDFAGSALDELAERAVAMARAVPEDGYCGLADPDQIAQEFPDLDALDPEEPSPELLIERARACEAAAREVPGITNSEGAEASWSSSRVAVAATNGFFGSYAGSRHSLGVSVLAGEGLGMERDYDFSSAVYGSDLRDPGEVGRSAAERAVRRLGPRKPKTGKVPILFDPRVANSLLRHFAGAVTGTAVARGTSFLKDKLGQKVFAEGIQVFDDPHRPRGLRSKPFDAEGLATHRRALIEDGVLTGWLLDLASARQLEMTPTGNASRGVSGPPAPSTSNLYLAPGERTPQEMIGEIDQGFYVTEMMGMGANPITGDYSRGAAGFWIEKGELAYPVSEATVAGNLKSMFLEMTPANDLVFRYGTDAPTLRVDGMTVAGS